MIDAPEALGPYSQAIKFGNLLFVSGNIPLDPSTGDIVPGGIEAQTEQVLKNLRAVVEASGSELGKVVKTTVCPHFILSIGEITSLSPGVFEEYGRFCYVQSGIL